MYSLWDRLTLLLDRYLYVLGYETPTINLCKITLKLFRANKQRSAPGNVLENLTKAIILLNSDNLFFTFMGTEQHIEESQS